MYDEMNKLERLISMRDFNQSVLSKYNYVMDDVGKSYHNARASYYEEQVIQQLPHVLSEMLEELIKRFDIRVKNEATPALRELNQQLRGLGK